MTVVDRAQDLMDAIVVLLEADAEIRALCDARTSNIVHPWNDSILDGAIPLIAFAGLTGGQATSAPMTTERYEIAYACFAKTRRIANALATRIPKVLTWSAFNSRSLDACLDPTLSYRRTWPSHDPLPNAPAQGRADVTVMILVTA